LTAPQPGDITAEMEADVECTHCGVVMTSWSAPGSPVRYYQCPFCSRTHSSPYGEVFRRSAGARFLGSRPAAGGIPEASAEDVHWAGIKASAARWFARLDAEGRRHLGDTASGPLPAQRRSVAIPLAGHRHPVEVATAAARRKA
jgi:hypothetical protein